MAPDIAQRISQVGARLQAHNNQYQRLEGEYLTLTRDEQEITSRIKYLEDDVLYISKAQLLLQNASIEARDKGREQIQAVVTHALQFVFGPEVSFEVELYETSGRPQAEFYMVTDVAGEPIRTKPLEANGGGVVDIIALALRIAVLQIHDSPVIAGPIILDEPGKHVSAEYIDKMASLLQEMSTYFGRQIIMVTHQDYLAQIADRSVKVAKVGRYSMIEDF